MCLAVQTAVSDQMRACGRGDRPATDATLAGMNADDDGSVKKNKKNEWGGGVCFFRRALCGKQCTRRAVPQFLRNGGGDGLYFVTRKL